MMKMHLKHLLSKILLILIVLGVQSVSAQSSFTYDRDKPPTMEMLIDAREVFEYEVTYGFFTLGWVKVELLPDTTFEGNDVFHLRTQIRSNNRVPFVGTRIVNYETLFQFNDEFPYSYKFWRDDVHDEEYERLKIDFDREQEKVFFYDRGELTDTLDLIEPASGGDVIFYFSRLFAGLEEPYSLPVYTEGQMGPVVASSGPNTEMRSYKAFDNPVETYLSEGEADIEGPFGFRGRFKSWFSTDDLRVPVEAHVRVIFGNVKVRLISYDRHGTN
jgi:hypothetical protein